MKNWLVAVIIVGVAVGLAFAGERFQGGQTVTHTINQTGDTSVVVKFNQFTGRDGYTYLDTIRIGVKVAASWTSPKTVRRIAVASSVDTSYSDTLIIDLGTNTDTIAYAVPQTAFTQASYIDSMVARINALTGSTDTVLAQDSVTYIRLVSKIAQDNLEGDARWTLAFGTGSNNMSEADSTFTTIKMVCDSMVATINALATVKDTVTAAVSGDTVYTITGRAGWPIVFKVGPADTCQDTVHVINAQAAAWNSYDTTHVDIPITMWRGGWNSLMGDFILQASPTTTKGYGTVDTAYFLLYKTWATTGSEVLISADTGAIPLSWHFVFDAKPDSIWGDGPMFMRIIQWDTASDTSGARLHQFNWGLTATE